MALENDSSPDNEDECMKKRYSRKSFEVRQKQSLLSDSDDDNKEDSEHCIIGEKRSIGRSQWVQCDNPECQKWRRIDYVIDIDEVESANWVCEMNKDEKKSACAASQETIGTEDEDDPCTTDHKPGMVLWGKVPGYPWWPCMVDNDPDIETFYWNEAAESSSEQKTSIHVTFFGKQCTRAWLYPHSLRDFSGKENIKDMGSMKFRGTNFKNDVTDAFNDAKQSLTLSVKERISKYGFTIRYDGKEYAGNPEEKSEEPRKSIISKRKTMKQHMKRTGDKETGDKGTGNKGTGNKETGNKKTRNKEAGNTEKKSKKQKRDLSKKQKSSGNNETDKLEMCKHRGIAKLSKTQERIKKKLKGLKNLKMKDRCPRSVGHTKQDADRATNETEVVPDVYTESDDGNVQYEESCPVTLPKSPKKYRNSGLLDFCNEGDSMTGEQRDRGLMKSVEIREEIREEQSKASPAKRKTESWQLTREEINSVPSLVKPTLVPIDEKLISERAEKMMKKAKKNLKNGDNIDLGDEASSKEDSQETDDCQSKKAAKKPASKGSGRKQSSGKQAKAKPVVVAEEHEEKLDHLAKTDKQDLIECQKDVKAKANKSAINNPKKKKQTKEKKKDRPIKKHSKDDEKSNDEASKLVRATETVAKENNISDRSTENKAAGSRSKSKRSSTVESSSEESKKKRKDENKETKKKQKEDSGKQHEKIKRNISRKRKDMYEIRDMNNNEINNLEKSSIDDDSNVEDNEAWGDAKTSKNGNASIEIKKNLKGTVKPGKKSTFAVPRKKSSNQENKDRNLESISSSLKRKQNPCKNGWDSINEMAEDGKEKARKMKYRGTQCMTAMADESSEVDDLDIDTTFKTNTKKSLVATSKSASRNKAKNAKKGEDMAVSCGIGKGPNQECSQGTETSSQDIISLQEATDIISEAFLNDSSSISNAVDQHVDEGIMPSNRRKKGTFMQISPLIPDNADEDLRLSPILKSTYQDTYSQKVASNFSHDMMDSVVPVNHKYADESDDSPEF